MRASRSILTLAVVLSLSVLLSATALAYTINQTSTGANIKWNATSVTYYVNTQYGPSGALVAIQTALVTWNYAGANFSFVYGGPTTSHSYGVNDGINICDWGAISESSTLAQNTYWYSTTTGFIADSDIRFNTTHSWATTGTASAYDVQNIATHELGHSLSLGDLYSSADSEKTMYGYASVGETKKRTLDQDDVNGIKAIYSLGRPEDLYPVIRFKNPDKGPAKPVE